MGATPRLFEPVQQISPAPRCRTCNDCGLIQLDGQSAPQFMTEIFERIMPCPMPDCAQGEAWRREFAFHQNPPKCSTCGHPAEVMLTSKMPLCGDCDRKRNAMRRLSQC